jgi:hypothetical protein
MNYAVEYRGRVKTKEKKGMEQIVSHHIYNRVFSEFGLVSFFRFTQNGNGG